MNCRTPRYKARTVVLGTCVWCHKRLTTRGSTYHRPCYAKFQHYRAVQNRCMQDKPESQCRICRPETFDPHAPSRYSPTRNDRPLPPAPRFSGRYAAIQQMTPEQIERNWDRLLDPVSPFYATSVIIEETETCPTQE